MFAALSVNGEPSEILDEDGSVTLEFDSYRPQYRCRDCGVDLVETTGGFLPADGGDEDDCPALPADDDPRPHDPERIPLSWCNGARITTDEADDAITVALSVGDPRGGFAVTIRRIPDDAPGDLAGRLVMHTPYPGEPLPHEQLSPLHPGTYLVGPPVPAHHLAAA
jgi:hypothetical protein